MNKVELLAPAGDLEKLKIAVEYGADAVYFGGEMFSLRAGAGNMTIDEMLVYLPQLSARASRLSAMKDMLPKERVPGGYGGSSQIIDYRYANFDIAEAKEDYAALTDELAKAQTALDLVNSTAELDIEI